MASATRMRQMVRLAAHASADDKVFLISRARVNLASALCGVVR
jgi:hypothetical protein